MGIYLKKFAAYFFILLGLLICVKIIIITILIVRGEWIASPGFLLSIVEWDKEALKILALAIIAAFISMYGYMNTKNF